MHRGPVGLRPALRDEQMERPVGFCPGCGGEVYHGERMTGWEGGWLCPDCFEAQITQWLRLAPGQLADALGLAVRVAEEGW